MSGYIIAFIVICILAFLTSFFSDKANNVVCFILSIYMIVVACIHMDKAVKWMTEDFAFPSTLVYSLILALLGVLRFTPLIWSWTEKHTFLVLGTLVEETDIRAGLGACVGAGILMAGVGGIFLGIIEKFPLFIWFIFPLILYALLNVATFVFSFIIDD